MKTKLRIKIFEAGNISILEREVNQWLDAHDKITILDTHFMINSNPHIIDKYFYIIEYSEI